MKKSFWIFLVLATALTSSANAACRQYGATVFCDDGSNYTTFGNTTFGSNKNTGSNWSQTQIGNSTFGKDSQGRSWSATRSGNSVFGTDANGNRFFCTTIGNQTICN